MEFAVTHIAAWSPNRPTAMEWDSWANSDAAADAPELCSTDVKKPKTSQVPPMVRRRLTLWGAMAVEVAFQCEDALEEDMPTVFASRHGDTHRTYELLANIAEQAPLSPTAFSLSVHNSSSGIFSITAKLFANAIAMAASKETLGHAFIEVNNLLNQGHKKVLLVHSDLPLADFYQDYADEIEQPHAFALVLEKGSGLRVNFRAAERDAGDEGKPLSLPLQFLKFWYSRRPELTYSGNRLEWTFARSATS